MHVQVNTDNNVEGHAALTEEVEAAVAATMSRFDDRITRVEVHLSDTNSHKSGGADKRCVMEARPAGRGPVTVSHNAAELSRAITGAASKLQRAVERDLARIAKR